MSRSAAAQLSLRAKLVRVQLAVAAIVLFICSLAFIINDLRLFKNTMKQNLESTTRILGINLVPALQFMDKAEATKILSSLKAEPMVTGAQAYDANGVVFSSYGEAIPPTPAAELASMESHFTFAEGRLTDYYVLKSDLDKVGVLVLRSEAGVLEREYHGYAFIVALVLSIGLALSFLLANFAQKSISAPIASLAEIAKRVSSSSDYSLRASKSGIASDVLEIQTLSGELDAMLERIQTRDRLIQEANSGLEQKIYERTAELRKAQQVALQNAHAAGMSEISTGILHNIGNIVNSINISVEEIQRVWSASKVPNLLKANELLKANPVPKDLVEYYDLLGVSLMEDGKKVSEETLHLSKKVALVKEVIVSQQDYSKGGAFSEDLVLSAVIDDMISLQNNALLRHHVTLTKTYPDAPLVVAMQRIKVAHVVLNLLKNAKEAMEGNPPDNRLLKVHIGVTGDQEPFVRIADNGVGISKENLEKIFNHGFTTKQTGHGFGLHFCANAMKEMGGRLEVRSGGVGMGAEFTLVFKKGATA